MIFQADPCSFPVLLHDKKTHVATAMLTFSHFAKREK